MLWLRRKAGEAITLPTLGVEIVVLAISGDTARIGIKAPDEINIYRAEVWRAIQRSESGSEETLTEE